MTYGTGPQALVEYLADNWQATRDGRPDIPGATTEYKSETGTVFITHDRSEVADVHSVHDLVHVYHPQTTGVTAQDKGSQEQGTVETVQIDVETTDRTDPETHERLDATTLLRGDRSDPDFPTDRSPPYPGIAGEVKYLLEDIRRGHAEWDKVSHDIMSLTLENSNARAVFTVDMEIIAENTVDTW